MADDFKYHIDHHVGVVAPAGLLDARAARSRGEIDEAALRAAEDAAIQEVLRTQRRIGLAAVSDGHLRRGHALAPYYDAVGGFAAPTTSAQAQEGPNPVAELLGALAPERRVLESQPIAHGRLTGNETAFLTSVTQHPAMLSLPSPGYVLALCAPQPGERGADHAEAAGAALAAIVHQEIEAAAADGIVYVLLHNPLAGILLTVAGREKARALGLDPEALLATMLEVDGKAVQGLSVPEDFRVGLDLTTSGVSDTTRGYDTAAVAAFVDRQPFARLCVEYPPDAANPFPVELLKPGTVVALGVVDVSDAGPETVEELVDRIDKAAAIVDIDDIAISTNGAFRADVPLTAAQQRDKLQLVEMVARYFWGNEL